jgi:PKD repeat protein
VQTFTLTVNSVNDAPEFMLTRTEVILQEDFTATEIIEVNLETPPFGEGSEMITYSISPAVTFANVSIDVNTGEVTISSVADGFGTQVFTVTANDGESTNNTFVQTFTLTVNSVNDAPEFMLTRTEVILQEDFTATEIIEVNLETPPFGEELETITYSITTVPFANVVINNSGVISITAIENAFSNTPSTITVTANDGNGGETLKTFTLEVNPVNDPPETSIPSISGILQFTETITGSYTYSDVDGDTESGTTFQWYRSDDNIIGNTDDILITLANSINYTIEAEDVGKFLIFEVTPDDGTEPGMLARAITSAPVGNPLLVTINANDGVGSLRKAVEFANARVGADIITFNISPIAPITLASELLLTDNSTTINGSSQSGIIITQSTGFSSNAFNLQSGNNTIAGLEITGFVGSGFRTTGDNNNITNSIITENQSGIFVVAPATNNSFVGNSIFDNDDSGIDLEAGANGNIAQPELTQIEYDGTTAGNENYTISGTAEAGASIQLFADNVEEGEVLLGTATAATGGVWSLIIAESAIGSFQYFTATQTVSGKGTSEFSTPQEIGFVELSSSDLDNQICLTEEVTFTYSFTGTTFSSTPSQDYILNSSSVVSTDIDYVTSALLDGNTLDVEITENGVKYISLGDEITTQVQTVGANFNTSETEICTGTQVDFTNISSIVGINEPSPTFFWDFKDGNTSTLLSPSHIFVTAGSYLVSLTVTSSLGCSSTFEELITVQPTPTVFAVTGGGEFCTGFDVDIELAGSETGFEYDLYLNGSPTGATLNGTGSVLSFTNITDVGVYTILARRASALTCEVIMSGSVQVIENPLPVANLSTTQNTICALEDARIDIDFVQGSFPYTIIIDDGLGAQTTLPGVESNTTITLNPTDTTTYTIISLTDINGCVATNFGTSVTFNVGELPVATVAIDGANMICIGESKDFNFTFTGVAPFTVEYTANGAPLSETFPSNSGVLTVNPTENTEYIFTKVIGGNSCESPINQTISVIVNPLPTAIISSLNPTICVGEESTLQFNFTGTPPYRLTYNDGVSDISIESSDASTTVIIVPTVTATYSLVSISDANGCSINPISGEQVTVTVNELPTVSFIGLESEYYADSDSITLEGEPKDGVNGIFTSDRDGLTDNEDGTAELAFSPSNVGVNEITYTFSDGNSCSNSQTQTTNVLPRTVLEPDLSALQAIRDTANSNGGVIPWGAVGSVIDATQAVSLPGVIVKEGRVIALNISEYQVSNLAENAFAELDFITSLNVSDNRLQFAELIATKTGMPTDASFAIVPQAQIGLNRALSGRVGESVTLEAITTHVNDQVEWFRDGESISTDATLILANLSVDDVGVYTYTVTNATAGVTDLTLSSQEIDLQVLPILHPLDARMLDYVYNSLGGENWNNAGNWDSDEFQGTWQGIVLGNDPADENFSRVISIDLSNNNLEGAIPDSIFMLPELVRLDLFNNNITGQIPAFVGDSTNLEYLDLDKNNLSGPVPSEIGKLTKLTTLWLARNKFNELPESIGDLTNLRNLFLQDNEFSSIPETVGNLSELEILDVNKNKLTVLRNLAGLTKLKNLRANNNQLTDFASINKIASLSNLEILDLSNNELDSLPEILSANHQKLSQLIVYNNRLDFRDLDSLVLDFGSNQDSFTYAPQKRQIPDQDKIVELNDPVFVFTGIEEGEISPSNYKWYQNDNELIGETSSTYDINAMALTDAGVYRAEVTSSAVPGLTISSILTNLIFSCGKDALPTAEIYTNFSTQFCDNEGIYAQIQIDSAFRFNSIQWRRNGEQVLGEIDSIITVARDGEYTLVVSDENGCSAVSNPIAISRIPAPQIAVETVDAKTIRAIVLSADKAGTYQWLRENLEIDGANDSIYVVTEADNYQVRYTALNGCSVVSGETFVTSLSDDALNSSTTVYPNPTKGDFSIEFGIPLKGEVTYRVYNSVGILIKEYTSQGKQTMKLDLDNQPTGIYFIEIRAEGATATKRIGKQ